MTTDDPILRELSDADPAIGHADAGPGETERVLRQVLSDGAPSRHRPQGARPTRRPWLTVALGTLSVLVVAAVVVVALGAGHRGGVSVTPAAGRSLTLIYRVQPTPHTPRLTSGAIDHELALIRERLRGLGARSRVMRVGADEIKVAVSTPHPSAAAAALVELTIAASDSVQFYDWEANVLLPGGRTVASQLSTHQATALTLSQGTASEPPGTADAGGVTLYRAIKVASTLPPAPTTASLSRFGPEYFSFGAPGSQACATAEADRGAVPLAGQSCYLAGPESSASALRFALPHGVSASDGKVLKVPQGVAVVQASNQNAIAVGAQTARFFVLRDRAALSGTQVSDPHAVVQNGEPEVQFAFTESGGEQFQSLTATIAHRGQIVSSGANHLFQHFAVAFDGRLLSVPQIDFTRYPDGVVETGHMIEAAILANSSQQAKQVVTQLRLGPLPLALHLVGERR
jgi:hypothetical protein